MTSPVCVALVLKLSATICVDCVKLWRVVIAMTTVARMHELIFFVETRFFSVFLQLMVERWRECSGLIDCSAVMNCHVDVITRMLNIGLCCYFTEPGRWASVCRRPEVLPLIPPL